MFNGDLEQAKKYNKLNEFTAEAQRGLSESTNQNFFYSQIILLLGGVFLVLLSII
jgi:hypothetical protein